MSFFLFPTEFPLNLGYAYSFLENELIDGYIRELIPICYGWKDGSSRIGDDDVTDAKGPTDCIPISNVPNGEVITLFPLILTVLLHWR